MTNLEKCTHRYWAVCNAFHGVNTEKLTVETGIKSLNEVLKEVASTEYVWRKAAKLLDNIIRHNAEAK